MDQCGEPVVKEFPEDRKQRVLKAALREFVNKGYAGTSTNVIAKEAGVAKGLVFHYFKSKKDLFLAVFNHCVETQMDYFFSRVRRPFPPDIIERMTEWAALKLEMVHRFPLVHEFLLRAYFEPPETLRPELEQRIQALNRKIWELFLEGIDLSVIRDDIDKQKAIQLLVVTMEGLQQQYASRYRTQPTALIDDADKAFEEFTEYLEILKYGLYKRPENESSSS